MTNDLIQNKPLLPDATSTVQQTGKNNVQIENKKGGVVNVTYNISSSKPTTTQDMIAIQSFSTKYYQLLVTQDPEMQINQCLAVSSDRALGVYYAPKEITERCGTLTDEAIKELKTFPAIICNENTGYNGETDATQCAVYGYITRVMPVGREIKIAFHPLGVFQQYLMSTKKNAIYFGLNLDCAITDLNHSGWYVRKANLFEAFDEAGIKNLPRPVNS